MSQCSAPVVFVFRAAGGTRCGFMERERGASRSTDDEEGESSPTVVSVGVTLDFFRRRFRLGSMTYASTHCLKRCPYLAVQRT